MGKTLSIASIGGWVFGLLFMGIGLINTFWGNDAGYGVFVVLLSLIFLPPTTAISIDIAGRAIPAAVKIVVGLFITWSALGVAELFDKLDLMMKSI